MNIYCVGSLAIDIIVYIENWPEEHTKLSTNAYVVSGGGSGANTAVELARRQKNVFLLSGIGHDVFGQMALRGVQEAGVDTSLVIQDSSWKTRCALIRSSATGKSMVVAGTLSQERVMSTLRELTSQYLVDIKTLF